MAIIFLLYAYIFKCNNCLCLLTLVVLPYTPFLVPFSYLDMPLLTQHIVTQCQHHTTPLPMSDVCLFVGNDFLYGDYYLGTELINGKQYTYTAVITCRHYHDYAPIRSQILYYIITRWHLTGAGGYWCGYTLDIRY